jgi:hypothetical protein
MGPTSQREDELIVQILRDQVGIDPRSLRPVLRLAAPGLVNSAWRNTDVENWHAEGRLHDGDMLRVSSHMSWRLDQLLWRWRTQMGIAPDAPAHALDEIGFDDSRWLGGRIYQWIVNPGRRLPTGMTLLDLARENLPRLENDADGRLPPSSTRQKTQGSASPSAGLPPTAASRAVTGGATPPGQSWWTGSSASLMTPATRTGATTVSSAHGYAPSPRPCRTTAACAGRCFSGPGPSTSAPPSGSWQQASATYANATAGSPRMRSCARSCVACAAASSWLACRGTAATKTGCAAGAGGIRGHLNTRRTGRGAAADTQAQQYTLDWLVAPAWVLPRHLLD